MASARTPTKRQTSQGSCNISQMRTGGMKGPLASRKTFRDSPSRASKAAPSPSPKGSRCLARIPLIQGIPGASTLRSEAQCPGDMASLAGAEASNDRVAGSSADDISFAAPNDVATDDELARRLRSALERALPQPPAVEVIATSWAGNTERELAIDARRRGIRECRRSLALA